jgi:REP element-mobilizing transposase RayT
MNEPHFHKRNLPHIYIPNSAYFITTRLHGSIPKHKLYELKNRFGNLKTPLNKGEKYKQESKFFYEYDQLLHKNSKINYLSNFKIAEIVKTQIFKLDKHEYSLYCFTIMPNHIHIVFNLYEHSKPISKIMQEIKRISAYYSNRVLNKKCKFWQAESYDHVIRDTEELFKVMKYVVLNPVKAGLVNNWEDWQHTYLSSEFYN